MSKLEFYKVLNLFLFETSIIVLVVLSNSFATDGFCKSVQFITLLIVLIETIKMLVMLIATNLADTDRKLPNSLFDIPLWLSCFTTLLGIMIVVISATSIFIR